MFSLLLTVVLFPTINCGLVPMVERNGGSGDGIHSNDSVLVYVFMITLFFKSNALNLKLLKGLFPHAEKHPFVPCIVSSRTLPFGNSGNTQYLSQHMLWVSVFE